MVRATVAFAVVALGAAAVIAQAPDAASELEARDFTDLELRAFEDMASEIDAREPELLAEYELAVRDFDDEALDAREQLPLPAPTPLGSHDPIPAATPSLSGSEHPGPTPSVDPATGSLSPSPTPPPDHSGLPPAHSGLPSDHSGLPPAHSGLSPSQTVTITQTPTPTSCTKKELKKQKKEKKIRKAVDIVNSSKDKKDMTREEKLELKKAKKFLSRLSRKRSKIAKRVAKKCRKALRKAGLRPADCKAGADCASAYSSSNVNPDKCRAAGKYLARSKRAKKAAKHAKKASKTSKNSKKSPKKFGYLLPPTKTTKEVGTDGITTVTVLAGPTCTPTSGLKSKSKKHLLRRELADEEFDNVFAREYDFDNLD